MAQRSYMNDRYRKDARLGSTRKSAAKAKPVRKQGSVSAKSKPAVKPKRERPDWMLPTSPEIKRWRRLWWVLLLGGLALIGIGYAVPALRENATAQQVIAVLVLIASSVAVSLDLFVIRKLRHKLIAERQAAKKSKKDAG